MNTISGMNAQAEAFSHFLNLSCQFEESTCFLRKSPYFNCRERGFVVSVIHYPTNSAKHFAWFEHRNSDSLCCVAWEGKITGENGDFFTVEDIPESAYPDKWTLTKSVHWGQFGEAAGWLGEEISAYQSTKPERKAA